MTERGPSLDSWTGGPNICRSKERTIDYYGTLDVEEGNGDEAQPIWPFERLLHLPADRVEPQTNEQDGQNHHN
jgi:hypothetical protein